MRQTLRHYLLRAYHLRRLIERITRLVPAQAIDPVTGDRLTRLEYATRRTQDALRSPWFILAFNLATLILMAIGLHDQWNYFASWLAIMVEWIVGTFMFGQTKRDAVVMREIRALARHIETLQQQTLAEVEQLEADTSMTASTTATTTQPSETRRRSI